MAGRHVCGRKEYRFFVGVGYQGGALWLEGLNRVRLVVGEAGRERGGLRDCRAPKDPVRVV